MLGHFYMPIYNPHAKARGLILTDTLSQSHTNPFHYRMLTYIQWPISGATLPLYSALLVMKTPNAAAAKGQFQ